MSASDRRLIPTKYKEVPATKWWRAGRLIYEEEAVRIRELLHAGSPIDEAYKQVIGIAAKPLHIYHIIDRSGFALHWELVQGEGVKAVHGEAKAPSIRELETIQTVMVDAELSLPGIARIMLERTGHEEYRDWMSMKAYLKRGGWELRQTISLPEEGV